jgi:hypothetical protein
MQHGIHLPEKPPREINVPYREQEIMNLSREKDPTLFKDIEKEHKSGGLEKMRKEYDANVKKEITQKNAEYKKEKGVSPNREVYSKTPSRGNDNVPSPYQTPEKKAVRKPYPDDDKEIKKGAAPVNKSPARKEPEYKSPTQRKYPEAKEYDAPSRQKDDDNYKKEKTPGPSESGVKNNGVMKNPYPAPNDNRKKPDQDAGRKPVPGTKR